MSDVALDLRFDGRDVTVGTHQNVEAIIEHCRAPPSPDLNGVLRIA